MLKIILTTTYIILTHYDASTHSSLNPFNAASQPFCRFLYGYCDDRWSGCIGIYDYGNGIIYFGDWQKGEPDGWGVLAADNYEYLYFGQFEDGDRNGKGFLVFDDGAFYLGTFKRGVRHGKFIVMYANGTKLTGNYVDGKRDGTWMMEDLDGTENRLEYERGRQTFPPHIPNAPERIFIGFLRG